MPRNGTGLRPLAIFWAVLLAAVAAGGIVLQVLGPPAPPADPRPTRQGATPPLATPPHVVLPPLVPAPSPGLAAHVAPAAAPVPAAISPPAGKPASLTPAALPTTPPAATPPPAPASAEPPARADGPVHAPDPALEVASADYPGGVLPRVGDDRRSPMQAYAAHANPAEVRPRIAILLSDTGLSQQDSLAAINGLPAAVSLAVSPYGTHLDALATAARAGGHELLMGLPMEPGNAPFANAGNHALLTGNSEGENMQRLDWALTRLRGYVGVTPALGDLHGERFAASDSRMRPILTELAGRGLLYVDPRPGERHPPQVVGRAVDVVLDEQPGAEALKARLADLERVAHDRGSAIGLAGPPTPVTVATLAAWAATLPSRGIALQPVSAVVPIVPTATQTAGQ